ncbi:3-methyladenine DNA glycosylase [Nibricoccus sp. IMCC34717]|uniref:3-methyladenine DNA glycosylase n=1 Tax=Nibricoccus sp. IMCC34717 TaxID=3034021 RepID=UPI003850A4EB
MHLAAEHTVLAEHDWQARAAEHEARVRQWTDPHQARASRGEKHPIYDFLFEYYAHRPAWLRRYHPGLGITLAGDAARPRLSWPGYASTTEGVTADVRRLPPQRLETVRWLSGMLQGMQARPALFGCFGLHEWAMVYRLQREEVRHTSLPLRLPPQEIAAVVESQTLCCTHFDAFRFFTPPARPLNRTALTRETTAQNEQRACLHANMDLYKWAFKLSPFTSSTLVADCFELALAIRELDMRASPYDVRSFGFEPVPVETAAGRADYERQQRDFARRAEPLRERISAVCIHILNTTLSAPAT